MLMTSRTPMSDNPETTRRLLTLYGRRACHLCEEMHVELLPWRARLGFRLSLVDIDGDRDLEARFGYKVPVLADRDEEICHHYLDETALLAHFEDP